MGLCTILVAQQLAIYKFETSTLVQESIESFSSSIAQQVYSLAGGYGVAFRGDMQNFMKAYRTFLLTGNTPGLLKGVNYALMGRLDAGKPYIESVALWKKTKKGKGRGKFKKAKKKLLLSGYRIVREKAPENETAPWKIEYIKGIKANYCIDVFYALSLVRISTFSIVKKESGTFSFKIATVKVEAGEDLPEADYIFESNLRKFNAALGEKGKKLGKVIAEEWLEPILGKIEPGMILKTIPTDVKVSKKVVLRRRGTITGYGIATLKNIEKGNLIYQVHTIRGIAFPGDEVLLYIPRYKKDVAKLPKRAGASGTVLSANTERIFRVNYEKFPMFFHSYTFKMSSITSPAMYSFDISGGIIKPANTGWRSRGGLPFGLEAGLYFLGIGNDISLAALGVGVVFPMKGLRFGDFSMLKFDLQWGTAPETIATIVKTLAEESEFTGGNKRSTLQSQSSGENENGPDYLSLQGSFSYIVPFFGDPGVRLHFTISANFYFLNSEEGSFTGPSLLIGGGLMWW